MLDDEENFLPPKDEEVPARLARKWEERRNREGVAVCRACTKQILASSSFCPYCGELVECAGRGWVWITAVILLIGLLFWGVRFFINL